MNTILKWSGVVALVILAIQFGLSGKQIKFGSTACSGITCLSGGLRLVSDAGGDFEVDVASVLNATTTSKNITVTTADTATSTVQVGCIQMTATSTATPVKLVFGNGTGASSAATTTFGSTMVGLAGWAYGKCPGI